MGKQRRKRTSFHTSPTTRSSGSLASASQDTSRQDHSVDSLNTTPINFTVPDNLFANVNINFASIKKALNDDTHSVKSYKSVKSGLMSGDKTLSKKDKLKIRKELLLQKIDTLNHQKKEASQRSKRRDLAVIGDTNPLLDALPSLESLIQNNKNKSTPISKGPKGIQTIAQRKRETIKNIQLYKAIKKNKKFILNPLKAITQHIRAVVEEETMKVKPVKPNKLTKN